MKTYWGSGGIAPRITSTQYLILNEQNTKKTAQEFKKILLNADF